MLRLVFLIGLLAAGPAHALPEGTSVKVLSFEDLASWADDDHAAALSVFLATCGQLDDPQWAPLCRLAEDVPPGSEAARAFFELLFRPVLIDDGTPCLFTGYYEPVIEGARQRSERFRWPVYARPPELRRGTRFLSRQEIEQEGALAGRELEIAWVADPVALQFLQIQGSGRIRFADGSSVRLGYAGNNGHPFRSLGRELVRRGIYNRHQVSARVISNWVRKNPLVGEALLYRNPSYVFFKVIERLRDEHGPLGAMNRPIAALRSVAIDPRYVPLGAPVWIETAGAEPMDRLMIAQDVGSRVKGAQRADIFFGTGEEAGKRAGRIRDGGRMVVLMPIQEAFFQALQVPK